MRQIFFCTIVALVVLFGTTAFSQDDILIGAYQEVDVSKQDAIIAEADVFRCGKQLLIVWSLRRNGTEVGSRSLAERKAPNTLNFDFVDAWGNKGYGSFTAETHSYILKTKLRYEPSYGDHVRSLYGYDWELVKISNQPNHDECSSY